MKKPIVEITYLLRMYKNEQKESLFYTAEFKSEEKLIKFLNENKENNLHFNYLIDIFGSTKGKI